MPKDNARRELKFYRFALLRAPWLMKTAWGVQKALLFITPVHRCRRETANVLREDGSVLHIDIFEPRTRRTRGKRLPTLLYFHGGGFGFEATPHHKKLMAIYAKRADCRVACPDYGLMPDAVYPVCRGRRQCRRCSHRLCGRRQRGKAVSCNDALPRHR